MIEPLDWDTDFFGFPIGRVGRICSADAATGCRSSKRSRSAARPTNAHRPGTRRTGSGTCVASSAYTVAGGSGGSNSCRGVDVGGGAGGIKHFMEHLMDPLQGMMKALGNPQITPELKFKASYRYYNYDNGTPEIRFADWVLTDAVSSLIIQRKILPAFKAGHMEQGVVEGAEKGESGGRTKDGNEAGFAPWRPKQDTEPAAG